MSVEQQSASDCLKEKGATVKWTNLGNCMPRGSKTRSQISYCVEEEFHARMRDLKREISLNHVLLIMITSFIHEIYEDMPYMHKILHVAKNSGNYTFIMSH